MRIAVCVKQVPDTEARLRVGKDGKWIDEEDLPFVINESDRYSLEEALQLTEKHGGEVVVFSLGPARVSDALLKALALGAASAVHLNDEAFEGGDATAIARALAAAVRAEAEEGGAFDLVLTGSQSDDVGYGGTGSLLAGHLDWPHAWLVMGVEVEESGTLRVVREMESGMNEILRLQMPAVLEIQAGLNQPRYPKLPAIMKAKKKPKKIVGAADLGLDPAAVGAAGSRLEVVQVAFPDSGEGAHMIEGDPADAARALVEKLQREARVL